MTHVACRLAAKNRDQLRNPTLGNRVWATFTFLPLQQRVSMYCVCVVCSQLRPPMMTSLLRKLVIDVPALTENTITPLRVSLHSPTYRPLQQYCLRVAPCIRVHPERLVLARTIKACSQRTD